MRHKLSSAFYVQEDIFLLAAHICPEILYILPFWSTADFLPSGSLILPPKIAGRQGAVRLNASPGRSLLLLGCTGFNLLSCLFTNLADLRLVYWFSLLAYSGILHYNGGISKKFAKKLSFGV